MRKPVVFFTSLLFSNYISAQIPKNNIDHSTKIIIIGVSHKETQFMNADSLLTILQQIKPDLILDEMQSPSGYYTVEKKFRNPPSVGYRLRNAVGLTSQMPPEKKVLYKYIKVDTNILIQPFDIYIKNRNKWISQDEKWEKTYIKILNSEALYNQFTAYRKKQHEQYVSLNNFLFNITCKSYLEMNQPSVADSLRKLECISDIHLRAIFDSISMTSSLKPYYEEKAAFWHERNKVMAENILDFSSKYSGKKIVVLTGLLHKYYLLDLLIPKQKEHAFILQEFYEINK